MTLSLTIAAFLFLFFSLVWWLCVKINNYSWVDVAWSLSFAPVACTFAMRGEGWGPRRLVVGSLVVAWSLRLGIYLWGRVGAHHPREDARYAVLREKWVSHLHRNFWGFFVMQGVLVWLLMLPVNLICERPETHFHPSEMIGLGLWFLALVGEGIADAQLAAFKGSQPDPKAVCDRGLWAWSRHPNYFFQSLLWWALFLMALPAPLGWIAIVAPIAMLHFLLNVTGVPLTEKLALEKRGHTYRAYQKRTSCFIPWPPKLTTSEQIER